eukprot:CFRG6220T1
MSFTKDSIVVVLKHGGALVTGMCATTVMMGVFELTAHSVYPDVSEQTQNDKIPAGAAALVLAGNVTGACAGAYAVCKLAPNHELGAVVLLGSLFTYGQYLNLRVVPHPKWFFVPGMLAFLPPSVATAMYMGYDTL